MMFHTSSPPSETSSPSMSPSSSFIVSSSNDKDVERHSASAKRRKYLKRILKFRHMDFEFALWQMIYLLISPQKVYRNFHYRKYTKDQFARDDPAFLVLLSFFLFVSSIFFAVVMRLSVVGFLKFLFWVIFVDCIGTGFLIATALWFITNKYLLRPTPDQQHVEWGYAFDVHLNAFFPLLVILHGLQLIIYQPMINHDSFVSTLIGNSLWLVALSYYVYITFLGYSVLPFLKKTIHMLHPLVAVVVVYIISLSVGWNISQTLMWFYKYRVL